MGMPSINITFTSAAVTSIARSTRGTVALILKESAVPTVNPATILYSTDIPAGISAVNKKQIELALMGYMKAPQKVICYFVKTPGQGETLSYDNAYKYFEFNNFDYLAIPTVETDAKTAEATAWIKGQRSNGKMCKAVLPNQAGDNEGIINFATASMTDGSATYTTEQYCSRIAGLLAGTPLTISSTFAPLTELADCSHLTAAERDAAIDAGKFIIYYDGEKVKTGRGVNSLVTTSANKGDSFKKIKIVEAMDMIYTDIKKTAQDSYLGKYNNSYDNKCLLMSAIGSYFDQMILDGIVDTASVEIDMAAQRNYLKGIGVAIDTMTEDQIKVYNTGSKVFLKAIVSIFDAIEDITLNITI